MVFDAIPSGLIQLLSGNISSEAIPIYTTNQLSIDGVKIIDKKFNNFYIRELCRITLLPKCKPFWNSMYNQIDWKGVWNLPSKYCLTNKVKEIAYKIIHLIYPVRQVVSRFFRDMETTCNFSNTEEESIKHLFFECVFSQLFWIDVEYLIFKFTKLKIQLSGKDIFLLYKNKSVEQNFVVNLIIMYGKYHIHKQNLSIILRP